MRAGNRIDKNYNDLQEFGQAEYAAEFAAGEGPGGCKCGEGALWHSITAVSNCMNDDRVFQFERGIQKRRLDIRLFRGPGVVRGFLFR